MLCATDQRHHHHDQIHIYIRIYYTHNNRHENIFLICYHYSREELRSLCDKFALRPKRKLQQKLTTLLFFSFFSVSLVSIYLIQFFFCCRDRIVIYRFVLFFIQVFLFNCSTRNIFFFRYRHEIDFNMETFDIC